ncbi:hypothetical protein GIW81_06145 [Hyphomicrobium sp. xq]|uniref:Uncharacterized protein n=1 Tax=Hyphomicrobium album TaxID=2665159 RepID=A0A6I3KEG5_9HYPH|nr:hypothetical protein [Hyphomicrobium album]MTD93915.1 hypothetical protein [Hyphomicrobium album]
MSGITVWIAYNTDDECFASHEGAEEALDGLVESSGHGEGVRVIELRLTLPSVKPLAVEAVIPERDEPVTIRIA